MRDRVLSTQPTCVHPCYTSGLYLCGMKAMQHHATAAPGKPRTCPEAGVVATTVAMP
jgi:hypothetical protein